MLNKKNFVEIKNRSISLLTELSSINYQNRCSITRQLGDSCVIEDITKSDNHGIIVENTEDGIIIKLNCGTTNDESHTLISMTFDSGEDKIKALSKLKDRQAEGIFLV